MHSFIKELWGTDLDGRSTKPFKYWELSCRSAAQNSLIELLFTPVPPETKIVASYLWSCLVYRHFRLWIAQRKPRTLAASGGPKLTRVLVDSVEK